MSGEIKRLKMSFPDWQSEASTVTERLLKVLELQEWSDCRFLVGPEEPLTEFNCHKLVFASSSPVFEALFYGSLAVKDNEPIILPDIEPDHFKLFTRYLYSDSLTIPDMDAAAGLLYVGKKYLIPDLVERCAKFLQHNMCEKSVVKILKVAETFRDNKLRLQCLELMCRSNYKCWWDVGMIQENYLSLSNLHQILCVLCHITTATEYIGLVEEVLTDVCLSMGLELNSSNKLKFIDKYCNLSHNKINRCSAIHGNLCTKQQDIFGQRKSQDLLPEKEILPKEDVSQTVRHTLGLSAPDPQTVHPTLGLSATHTTTMDRHVSEEKITMRSVFKNSSMSHCNYVSTNEEMNSSTVKCYIRSRFRILVTGFTMNTQSFPSSYFSLPVNVQRNEALTYSEQLSIKVEKLDGFLETGWPIIISTAHPLISFVYKNSGTFYNSTMKIMFPQPFWAEPFQNYMISVRYDVSGVYSYEDMSKVIKKDSEQIDIMDYNSSKPFIVSFCFKSFQLDKDLLLDDS